MILEAMALLALGSVALAALGGGAERAPATPPRPSTEGARDLTRAEAIHWLDAQMHPPPVLDEATGEMRPSQKTPLVLAIKQAPKDGMWVLDGTEPIEGVDFRYRGTPTGPDSPRDLSVTPAMLVLLVRLARFLRSRNITRARHAGIFPGDPSRPADTHNHGGAIDLSEFVGSDGAVLSIAKDWGMKPSAGPGKYRLRAGDPGFAFFRDLYRFLSLEATDKGAGKETVPGTALGGPSYILTPDTPHAAQAEAHQGHIHAQVGPTRWPSGYGA